jgi:shikimate kinase
VIHLIGPGGAGKSTVGPRVAELLGRPALDLDRLFEARHGSIDEFIHSHGYLSYAAANVDSYLHALGSPPAVIALSSGFMTYGAAAHHAVPEIQRAIVSAATTFLLIPSLDLETAVAELVRRQATRLLPSPRSALREEAVARERIPRYLALPVRRVTTMRPAPLIASEIATLVAHIESGPDRPARGAL